MAQEVLLRLVRLVRSDRVRDPGSFQKLVYALAKNVCVDAYHRERTRERVLGGALDPEDEPVDLSPDRAGATMAEQEQEQERVLAYVLQRLSEGCRELLGWVYGEGVDAAEAGRRLGIQAGAVRVRVHRCLKKARESMDDRFVGGASRGPRGSVR